MSETSIAASSTGLQPWRWRLAFAASMFGAAILLVTTGAPREFGLVLLILPVLFAAPMMQEANRRRTAQGEGSPALARYDRRAMIAVLVYLGCLLGATNLGHAVGSGSPLLWFVALLPMLPIVAVVWAMMRYLAEETDEYLRHRAVTAALIGLAAILVLATVWGFLETFALVPHVPGWWVVPAFVFVRDLARTVLRERSE